MQMTWVFKTLILYHYFHLLAADCKPYQKNSITFYLFIYRFIYLFIYFWLRWVFIAARGLSLVAVGAGYSSLVCTGFSLWWLLFVAEHGL